MTRRVQQACVWTRFSMSWAYTWGLCCSGGVENTVILPHVSQCSCSQAWRRAVVRAPCYGHALSSRQGWKARPWEVAAVFSRTLPGHRSCGWLHCSQHAQSTVPSAGPLLTPLPLSASQSLSPSLQRACSARVLSGYYPQLAWSSPGGGPGRRSETVTFGQRPGVCEEAMWLSEQRQHQVQMSWGRRVPGRPEEQPGIPAGWM